MLCWGCIDIIIVLDGEFSSFIWAKFLAQRPKSIFFFFLFVKQTFIAFLQWSF